MSEHQFDSAKIRLPDGSIGYDAAKLAQLETEGIWLKGSKNFPRSIPNDCVIVVGTRNSTYLIIVHGDNYEAICQREDGREDRNYIPTYTKVSITGSTFGGSMLKMGYIGVGMHIEFYPEGGKGFTTSPVQWIKIQKI